MEVSAHRAFQMLKSLAYVRLSASPEEAQAASVLKKEQEKFVQNHVKPKYDEGCIFMYQPL